MELRQLRGARRAAEVLTTIECLGAAGIDPPLLVTIEDISRGKPDLNRTGE